MEVSQSSVQGSGYSCRDGHICHLDGYVTELEAIYMDRGMRGLYQHLKRSVGLSGRQAEGQQYVTDENGVLLHGRNKDDIFQQWARFFGTFLNTKSPTLDPEVIEQVTQRPATYTCHSTVVGSSSRPGGGRTGNERPAELEGTRQ